MNSDVLNNGPNQTRGVDLKLLSDTMGLWRKPSSSCSPTESTESQTPHLLSSSNSVACTLSPRPKRKRIRKKLFKKHLTFNDVGVNEIAMRNSDRGYKLVYHNVKKRRLASQDALTFDPSILDEKSKSKPRVLQPLHLDLARIHPTRTNSAVHFSPSTKAPTLSQLKKALRAKLVQARENRPSKRQRIARSKSAPEPNIERGQSVECVGMNTGSLYIYKGGDLPRKVVFIRRL